MGTLPSKGTQKPSLKSAGFACGNDIATVTPPKRIFKMLFYGTGVGLDM